MRNRCYENDFDLHENETALENSFSHERVRTKTRFATEVQEESEMAYWLFVSRLISVDSVCPSHAFLRPLCLDEFPLS